MYRVKVTFEKTGETSCKLKVERLDDATIRPQEFQKRSSLKKNQVIQNFQDKTGIHEPGEYTLFVSQWPPTEKSEWPKDAPTKTMPKPQMKVPAPQSSTQPTSSQPINVDSPSAKSSPGSMLHSLPSQMRNVRVSAKAPYNFISQPPVPLTLAQNPPGHHLWDKDRYSGVIHCEMENLTPIYTRDGRGQKDEEGHVFPDFFHLDHDAESIVVPPRTLKGMIRSIMEILSLAPLRPDKDFDSKQYTWRSVTERSFSPKFRDVQAGILVESEGRLSIQPYQWMEVKHTKLKHFADWQEFLSLPSRDNKAKAKLLPIKKVKFIPSRNIKGESEVFQIYAEDSKENPSIAQPGYLVVTGHIDTKKREFVFYQPATPYLPIPESIQEKYNDFRTDFMEDYLPNHGKLIAGEPVFYLQKNDAIQWLGRARIFRLPFAHATGDFALRYPDDQMTIPDFILGFTDQKLPQCTEPQSYQGRISISAAFLQQEQGINFLVEEGNVLEPYILSSPKPTTFQHYLVQQEENQGKSDQRASYNDRPLVTSILRGRKLYLPRRFNSKGGNKPCFYGEEKPKDAELDKQHTHIRPLASGHIFTFEIHFDNLTNWELGLLTLALTLDFVKKRDAKTNYAHKIGMAKPLGLGSVKLRINQISLINRVERYSSPIGGCSERSLVDEELQQELGRWRTDFERFILQEIEKHKAESKPIADWKCPNPDNLTPDAVADWYETQLACIAELRRMCDYGHSPDYTQTRYMEIEKQENGERVNEFKERPILPSPLDI